MFKKVDINVLGNENLFNLIGREWMLITAGTMDSFNMMTASWGSLGILWNRNVATIYVRPTRYTHEFIENNERLTLSFMEKEFRKAMMICGSTSGRDADKAEKAGLHPVALQSGVVTFSESRLVLECRKLYHTTVREDQFTDRSLYLQWYNEESGDPHSIYILEIESVYVRA